MGSGVVNGLTIDAGDRQVDTPARGLLGAELALEILFSGAGQIVRVVRTRTKQSTSTSMFRHALTLSHKRRPDDTIAAGPDMDSTNGG